MISFSRLVIVAALGCLVSLGLIAGCSKSTVDAVPRNSNSKPVFGNVASGEIEKRSGDINFDFLHADHFACLGFNVDQIVSNEQLKEVPWDFLEAQLAGLVGQDNARLDSIQRIWLLLDRESISLAMEGNTDGMLVAVIDYKKAPNLEQVTSAAAVSASLIQNTDGEKTDQNDEEQATVRAGLVAELIGDKRIAIGSEQLVAKMKVPQQPVDLSRKLSQLDFTSDVEGIIAAGPIRETLRSVFGLAAQFGGEEAKKFANLPEVLEQIEVRLSLSEDSGDEGVLHDLMNLKIVIDNEQMISDVIRTAQQAIDQLGSQAASKPSAMGAMFGQGFQRNQKAQSQLFPLQTPKVAEKVSRDIQERDLFSIEGSEKSVSFLLRRPEHIPELVEAMIADAKRGEEFNARAANMGRIAKAMKLYHEKHGCFPPPGAVRPDDALADDSVPLQLNWRVGLLPFLGQQTLYDQFDFEQDWDSEFNLKIAALMPEVFSAGDTEESPVTRFHLPGGELGLFDADAVLKRLSDITDRKTWTAIIVESGIENQVVWTKPGALLLSKDSVEQADDRPLGRSDENGVLFANAAFKSRVVKNDPTPMSSILTAQGGEKLTTKDFYSVARD